MTLDSNIAAIEQEVMPEFYEITSGNTIDRWTSFNQPLTFLTNTWTPAPFKRSGLSIDTDFGAVKLAVFAPLTGNFTKYIANQPIEPVILTLYRALKSDLSDYVVLFKGRLINVIIENGEVKAECESRSTIFSKKVPNIIYQSWCNNAIFDTKCALSEFDWRVVGTVTDITGSDYTISGLSSYDDGYFGGGTIQVANDFRLILNHTGDVANLHIPFDARVYVGSEVVAFPGCDGAPTTCLNVFDNLLNFLGMPYIPSHNPVVWGFK